MPRVIKRYSNRKCYDTETSRYVNLDDIEKLVRDEVDIEIVDNETQEDVTAIYLSKIIMTQEKKAKDAFTPLFLRQEIQRRSEPIVDAVRRSLRVGSDLLSDEVEEGKRVLSRLGELVRDSKSGPSVAKELLGFLNLRDQRLISEIETRFQEFLASHAVATRADIEVLEKKIDDLGSALDKLN